MSRRSLHCRATRRCLPVRYKTNVRSQREPTDQERAQRALSERLSELLEAVDPAMRPGLDRKGYLLDPRTGTTPHDEPDIRRLARFNAVPTVSEKQLSLALTQVRAGAGSELRSERGR